MQHTVLVGEAADLIIAGLAEVGVPVDAHFVRLGVVFHDAGKIRHPPELSGPGHEHETSGGGLLIAAGVDQAVARCCLSHARWQTMEVTFEELVVALADTLWKGARNVTLEKNVIDGAAGRTGRAFWDLFVPLDPCFEEIAADGAGRLARSG